MDGVLADRGGRGAHRDGALAIDQLEVLRVPLRLVMDVMERNPKLSIALMKMMGERRMEAERRIEALLSRGLAYEHEGAIKFKMQREPILIPDLVVGDVLRKLTDREEVGIPMTGDEAWDLLPGYLVFRSLMSGRPPTCETVRALVDDVLMPSLIRGPRALIT